VHGKSTSTPPDARCIVHMKQRRSACIRREHIHKVITISSFWCGVGGRWRAFSRRRGRSRLRLCHLCARPRIMQWYRCGLRLGRTTHRHWMGWLRHDCPGPQACQQRGNVSSVLARMHWQGRAKLGRRGRLLFWFADFVECGGQVANGGTEILRKLIRFGIYVSRIRNVRTSCARAAHTSTANTSHRLYWNINSAFLTDRLL
jgi:hypothetical protein